MEAGIMKFVALLRGINLGKRNKVKMVELREVFTNMEFSGVQTYIQTGNVFFTGNEPNEIEIEIALKEAFGFDIPVMIRNKKEIVELSNHPFLEKDGVTVFFLEKRITDDQHKILDEVVSDPFVIVNGNHLLIQHTKNYHQTKYTNNYFEAKLNMYSTARNKNTTMKLKEKILEI
jgi:uncharacterized protein (DUF1697 family)